MDRARDSQRASTWWQSAGPRSFIAATLLWLAFPPLNWSWLAWLAPVFWLRLIEQKQLPGERPYRSLWLTSGVHWCVLLEGVRRAHPANHVGLVLLAAYLAVYLPVFVAIARVAVHKLRIPLCLAAPAIWTGLELARGHLITGFSMAQLGHTQVGWLRLIQIADVFGAYGVSFVVMFGAACLSQTVPRSVPPQAGRTGTSGWVWRPAVVGAVGLMLVLGYGEFRLRDRADGDAKRWKVALLQGTADTVLDSDIDRARQRADDAFEEYRRLSERARDEHPDLKLIVWPESVFTGTSPELIRHGELSAPIGAEISDAEYQQIIDENAAFFSRKVEAAAIVMNQVVREGRVQQLDIHLLVGTDTIHFEGDRQYTYNTALLISPDGDLVGRYYKMHRVMCGEYLPFGDTFPWIYDYFPNGRGLTPGEHPASLVVDGLAMTPNICFESTVPHLIRRQADATSGEHPTPSILINLTNDGWFWGSAILDLQLACEVFRAVELRKPFLIAANTGISAWIAESGEILAQSPRRRSDTLICNVAAPHRSSLYASVGDPGAALCLAFAVVVGAYGILLRRKDKIGGGD